MADPLDPADFDFGGEPVLFQDVPEYPYDPEPQQPGGEPDAGSLLAEVQEGDYYYPDTTVDVRYDYHPGVKVQVDCDAGDPLNGAASNPGRVVKMHGGFWTKTVQWSFERTNDWPMSPHPVSTDPNEVLIECVVTPAKPLELARGRAYRCSGYYVYHLLVPPTGFGPFPTATSEDSVATQQDNTAPAAMFTPGLLGQ